MCVIHFIKETVVMGLKVNQGGELDERDSELFRVSIRQSIRESLHELVTAQIRGSFRV